MHHPIFLIQKKPIQVCILLIYLNSPVSQHCPLDATLRWETHHLLRVSKRDCHTCTDQRGQQIHILWAGIKAYHDVYLYVMNTTPLWFLDSFLCMWVYVCFWWGQIQMLLIWTTIIVHCVWDPILFPRWHALSSAAVIRNGPVCLV